MTIAAFTDKFELPELATLGKPADHGESFFVLRWKRILIYDQLAYIENLIKMAKKNNELDYTYFKKSIDVDEAMKEPKEGQEFIDILQKEDYGHMVLFSSAEKQQALNFF